MTKYREILRLFLSLHMKTADIMRSCHVSPNTITKTKKRAAELGLSWPLPEGMTEEKLADIMFPKKNDSLTSRNRHLPDLGSIHVRLQRDRTSRRKLWKEYAEECRKINEKPLMYQMFCRYIQEDQKKRLDELYSSSAPLNEIETGWLLNPLVITERTSCKVQPVSLFVAAMEASGYAYAEAFTGMLTADQIRANVRLLSFLGGVPKMIVQDMAPGRKYDLSANDEFRRAFLEFSEHYGTAIIPEKTRLKLAHAREDAETAAGEPPESPAARAAAWLLEELRGEKFFSICVLNLRLHDKIAEYNSLPAAEDKKSRERLFRKNELPVLSPLPEKPYVFVIRRNTRVQLNSYVTFDYMRYSVPIEHAGKDAEVRATDADVEIFVGGERVAAHRRLYGRKGQYSTVYRHLSREKKFDWVMNEEELLLWAKEIGPNTEKMELSILEAPRTSRRDPCDACQVFLMFSKVFTPAKLESACRDAYAISSSPDSYTVKAILREKYSIPIRF